MPRRRFWQSGGMKCGMWNTPSFTFSSRFLRLSSSNGRAPWQYKGKTQTVRKKVKVVWNIDVGRKKPSRQETVHRENKRSPDQWTEHKRFSGKLHTKKPYHILSLNVAAPTKATCFLNLFKSPIRELCPLPGCKINNKQGWAENRAFLIITQLSHLPFSHQSNLLTPHRCGCLMNDNLHREMR